MSSTWEARALKATRDTTMGAILAAALGDEDRPFPRFGREASITSDGFLVCEFNGKHNAFVCSVEDLERNLSGLSRLLSLTATERAELVRTVEQWIVVDYRGSKLGLNLPDLEEEL